MLTSARAILTGGGHPGAKHGANTNADDQSVEPLESHALLNERRLLGGLLERTFFAGADAARLKLLAQSVRQAPVALTPADRVRAEVIAATGREKGPAGELLAQVAEEASAATSEARQAIRDGWVARRAGASDDADRLLGHLPAGLQAPLTAARATMAMSQAWAAFQRSDALRLADEPDCAIVLPRGVGCVRVVPPRRLGLCRFSADWLGYRERLEAVVVQVGRAAGALPVPSSDIGLLRRPAVVFDLAACLPGSFFERGFNARMQRDAAEVIAGMHALARAEGLVLIVDAPSEWDLDGTWRAFEAALEATSKGTGGNRPDLGFTVSAASRRALALISCLAEVGSRLERRVPVRLVGFGPHAADDVCRSREERLADDPLLTAPHRVALSYLACAQTAAADRGRLHLMAAPAQASEAAAALLASAGQPVDLAHAGAPPARDAMACDVVWRRTCNVGATADVAADLDGGRRLHAVLAERQTDVSAEAQTARDEANQRAVSDPHAVAAADYEALAAGRLPQHWLAAPTADASGRLGATAVFLATRARHAALNDMVASAPTPWMLAQTEPTPAETAEPATTNGGVHVSDPRDTNRVIAMAETRTADDVSAEIVEMHDAFLVAGAKDVGWLQDRAAAVRTEFIRCRSRLLARLVLGAGLTIDAAQAAHVHTIDALARVQDGLVQRLGRPASARTETPARWHGTGVIGLFVDIDADVATLACDLLALLAGGNRVVVVPPPEFGPVVDAVVGAFHAAGFSSSEVSVLFGDGAAQTALLTHPDLGGLVCSGGRRAVEEIASYRARARLPLVPVDARMRGPSVLVADDTANPNAVAGCLVDGMRRPRFAGWMAIRAAVIADPIFRTVADHVSDALADLEPSDAKDDAAAMGMGPLAARWQRDAAEAMKARLARAGDAIHDRALRGCEAHGAFVAPAAYRVDDVTAWMSSEAAPVLVVQTTADRGDEDLIRRIARVRDLAGVAVFSRRAPDDRASLAPLLAGPWPASLNARLTRDPIVGAVSLFSKFARAQA